jgi:hypothetical protein
MASHQDGHRMEAIMNWNLDDTIEDLVSAAPDAVSFLMDHNIRCLACGEPIWGTIGEAMEQRGYSQVECTTLLRQLNDYLAARQQ